MNAKILACSVAVAIASLSMLPAPAAAQNLATVNGKPVPKRCWKRWV